MCGGGSDVNPQGNTLSAEDIEASNAIEERLMAEIMEEKKVVKVLLLGAGECGKSTILKQMQILHKNGWDTSEKMKFKALLLANLTDSIQSLCRACFDLEIKFDSDQHSEWAEAVCRLNPVKDNSAHKTMYEALWADKGVQEAFERQNEFHLLDSAPYFLKHTARMMDASYVPNEEDILRSRVATTGIVETDFEIDKMKFIMYDVGGQRGERKRWIHCFDSVTAIMFIAALSEYDQVLAEDRSRNRLCESLDLFEGIINLPWFKDVAVILFLNKKDLFEVKVAKVDIGTYHPSYTGGLDYDAGAKFIQEEYFARNQNTEKDIFAHITDATNTENVRFVWKVAKHTILESALQDIGLLM